MGTVGTRERMEHTAIGATVNLASRVCSTAQRGQVVISDQVLEAAAAEFVTEARPPVKVKGINRDLTTHLVVGKR